MSGFFSKNVPAVRISQVIICHAACENYGFYGGLVIPFPAFSGVFSGFGFRAKKFRAGFFRVSAVFFVPVGHASLPFPFTPAPYARTYTPARNT